MPIEALDPSSADACRPPAEGKAMRQSTITAFLDSLADRTPAPAGGATAALHLGHAAALMSMVARYSTGPRYAEHAAVIDGICSAADAIREQSLHRRTRVRDARGVSGQASPNSQTVALIQLEQSACRAQRHQRRGNPRGARLLVSDDDVGLISAALIGVRHGLSTLARSTRPDGAPRPRWWLHRRARCAPGCPRAA